MWKNPYQMIFENYPTWAFSKERFLKKKKKKEREKSASGRLWAPAAFPVCGVESVSLQRPRVSPLTVTVLEDSLWRLC